MGLADRDYIRAGPPPNRATEAARRHPRTLVMLCVLGAVQFLQWKATSRSGWTQTWWLSAEGVWHGKLWTLFTAALCHASALHLVLIAWGLALCGRACEREGRAGWFWLLPVAAGLGHVGVVLVGGAAVPPMAGAEAALIGWATALALHPDRSSPDRRAALVPLGIGVCVGLPVRIALASHWSPLGLLFAAPVGAVAVWGVRARRRKAVGSLDAGLALRAPAEVATDPQADLDALLQRVSEVGMDGLSPDERTALERASASLRQRRGY